VSRGDQSLDEEVSFFELLDESDDDPDDESDDEDVEALDDALLPFDEPPWSFL